MRDEDWMDFIEPDAGGSDPGMEWQSPTTQEPLSLTDFHSNRLEETSLLQTGASFHVEPNADGPRMESYQQSFSEMEDECETIVPDLNTASNSQVAGFLHPNEAIAALPVNDNIRNFNYSQTYSDDADSGQHVYERRTTPPSFNFSCDGVVSRDSQQDDVAIGSTEWYHGASYGQLGQEANRFTPQYIAGHGYGPEEHHRHARFLGGNVPRPHETSMPDQRGVHYAHAPPWNHLGLHAVPGMAVSYPACNFSGSPSRANTGTNWSSYHLSNTGTFATTPRSAVTGMWDSLDTAPNVVSADAANHLPKHQTSGFSDGHSAVYGMSDGLRAPEFHDWRSVPNTAMEINCMLTTLRSHHSVSVHAEITSQYSSVGPPASVTPSHDSETWYCRRDGCSAKFSGRYGRGNRNRHKKQKHAESGDQKEYPCEVIGCDKIYMRQDARLKHYRKRHPNKVATKPLRVRK